MRLPTPVFLGAALFLVASAVGSEATSGADAKRPAWFTKAMAKEKRVRRSAKFSTADGLFSGRLPGKMSAEPSAEDGFWYLESDFGADAPYNCWLFSEPVDTGSALNQLTQALLAEASKENGRKLSAKKIANLDVNHIGGRPLIVSDWIYTLGVEKKLAGYLKVRTAVVQDRTLICAHNELGYQQTFSTLFSSLIESLVVNDKNHEEPYYASLMINSVGSQRVGFTRTAFTLDEEGDTYSRISDVTLLPIDGKTLSASDGEHFSYSTPSGELINAASVEVENGEVLQNLRLDYREDQWQVEGTLQGKPLRLGLADNSRLFSELGQAYRVQELQRRIRGLQAPGATVKQPKRKRKSKSGNAVRRKPELELNQTMVDELVVRLWVPSVDPSILTDAQIKLAKDARNGVMNFGALTMSVGLDEAGIMYEARYDSRDLDLRLVRVWEQGAILPPKS